ncbi:hypothetical protein R80B4_00168 [Fibrobacteres bacterium R8-0-B4]
MDACAIANETPSVAYGSDPHISAWYKRFLASEFDSSGIFEHPDASLPDEQFDIEPENADLAGTGGQVAGIELDIREAVEAM